MMLNLFRILSLSWMSLIFFFSSLEHSDLKQLPHISDIIAHGMVYAVLGALLYFSFSRHRGSKAVLIAFLYGVSDEIHQYFVPGRTPEIKDLIVDTAGSLIAVTIISFWGRRFGKN